jgi:hypothetical protein
MTIAVIDPTNRTLAITAQTGFVLKTFSGARTGPDVFRSYSSVTEQPTVKIVQMKMVKT